MNDGHKQPAWVRFFHPREQSTVSRLLERASWSSLITLTSLAFFALASKFGGLVFVLAYLVVPVLFVIIYARAAGSIPQLGEKDGSNKSRVLGTRSPMLTKGVAQGARLKLIMTFLIGGPLLVLAASLISPLALPLSVAAGIATCTLHWLASTASTVPLYFGDDGIVVESVYCPWSAVRFETAPQHGYAVLVPGDEALGVTLHASSARELERTRDRTERATVPVDPTALTELSKFETDRQGLQRHLLGSAYRVSNRLNSEQLVRIVFDNHLRAETRALASFAVGLGADLHTHEAVRQRLARLVQPGVQHLLLEALDQGRALYKSA